MSSATNNFPIVMFDCSGSTELEVNVSQYFQGVNNVLCYEICIAQRILKAKKYTHAYVVMWNSTGRICSPEPINVLEFNKISLESFGGTYLTKGFEVIPQEWVVSNNKREMYIFTDGEIEDDNYISIPLKKFIESNISIQIVTIEANNTNYVQTKAEAGNKLYQVLKRNGLTIHVRRFSSYNEHHVLEPFISFDNPEEMEGFTPFRGEYFDINEQQDELIEKIEESVSNCETKDDVVKLAHELTITVSHMTKNKTTDEINEINTQFADLFAENKVDPSIFTKVNNMLLLEANNNSNGNASTYHEFKDALILFEE